MTITRIQELRLGKDTRTAIVGQSGTGKSFLARRLCDMHNGRLGIVDPKRTFDYPKDLIVYDDPRKLVTHKPDRFIYRPKVDYLNNIKAYDLVYRYCYDSKNILCYTDDVVGIMNVNKYPKYLQVCYQMGRELNVAMVSSFQRPSWLPGFLLSEAVNFFCFRVVLPQDILKIKAVVPGYATEILTDRHTFAYYNQLEMETCEPLKIRKQEYAVTS